jgi:hypothetical protein
MASSSAGAATEDKTEDKMARHARLRKAGGARFDRNLNLRPAPSLFFITSAFGIQPLAFQFTAFIGHLLNEHYS